MQGATTTLVAAGLLLSGVQLATGGGTPGEFDLYVLAQSWQPAFCQSSACGHNRCPGCDDPPTDAFMRTHLTLHGLWPQYSTTRNGANYPSSCSHEKFNAAVLAQIPGGHQSMEKFWPNVKADPSNWNAYSSFAKHEWDKHGTCTGMSQVDYFTAAIGKEPVTPEEITKNVGGTVAKSVLQRSYRFSSPAPPSAGACASSTCVACLYNAKCYVNGGGGEVISQQRCELQAGATWCGGRDQGNGVGDSSSDDGSKWVSLGCTGGKYLKQVLTCWSRDPHTHAPKQPMQCPESVLEEDSCSGSMIHIAAFPPHGQQTPPPPPPGASAGADGCVHGHHGPRCRNNNDCRAHSGCLRCAHSGFCTNVPGAGGNNHGGNGQPSAGSSCGKTLSNLCGNARRATRGDCYVCIGQHLNSRATAAAMQSCEDSEFDEFCDGAGGH